MEQAVREPMNFSTKIHRVLPVLLNGVPREKAFLAPVLLKNPAAARKATIPMIPRIAPQATRRDQVLHQSVFQKKNAQTQPKARFGMF
jgi:hypothetical protein